VYERQSIVSQHVEGLFMDYEGNMLSSSACICCSGIYTLSPAVAVNTHTSDFLVLCEEHSDNGDIRLKVSSINSRELVLYKHPYIYIPGLYHYRPSISYNQWKNEYAVVWIGEVISGDEVQLWITFLDGNGTRASKADPHAMVSKLSWVGSLQISFDAVRRQYWILYETNVTDAIGVLLMILDDEGTPIRSPILVYSNTVSSAPRMSFSADYSTIFIVYNSASTVHPIQGSFISMESEEVVDCIVLNHALAVNPGNSFSFKHKTFTVPSSCCV
jgi:hypothetical protein